MKINLINLGKKNQEVLNNLINSGTSRSRVVSIALAKVISDRYEIIISDMDFNDYFDNTILVNVSNIINDLNDTMIICINEVIHYLRCFLKARYIMVNVSKTMSDPIVIKEAPLFSLLGIDYIFTIDDDTYIKENNQTLTRLLEELKPVINEIMDKGTY